MKIKIPFSKKYLEIVIRKFHNINHIKSKKEELFKCLTTMENPVSYKLFLNNENKLNDAYKRYKDDPETYDTRGEIKTIETVPAGFTGYREYLSKEQFIERIKINKDFNGKWGIKNDK